MMTAQSHEDASERPPASRYAPVMPPTPPAAPLSTPTQALDVAPPVNFPPIGASVRASRVVAFGGALALTVVGTYQMALVFDPTSLGGLQFILLALFVATFAWIAFSASSAFAGALFSRPAPRLGLEPLTSRTAIIMPIYHEDAAKSFGALAAMARGLADLGHSDRFEVVILSDTRDPDAWAQETTAFGALRARLGDATQVWYRRRENNVGRKAGNVLDFVTRWGARYDFMLVLDADSLMAPDTIVEMARRMQADPGLGLLQTVPQLTGGVTPFARLQQFAGSIYGPSIARGVAAWQGEDGNFWGHNALIRVRAFAESASLPELHGRKPFGGHILSHDFVEAALLRRAGWGVRMDVDLAGSWEGAPPSLLAAAVRDRRWAQGNMQHLAVIGAAGLRWPNRAHFAIGVLSYLMSPIWLAMLLVGLALTAQATLYQPEYFAGPFQLFPDWPRFDAERMKWLFIATMALLLAPKALGLAHTLAAPMRRRAHGGGARIVAGVAAEVVVSSLIAPVAMLLQSRHVAEIFAGRDSGWDTQERDGKALRWRSALSAHGAHCAMGVALFAAVRAAQPELLIWLSPIILGLVSSPVLSRLSGDPRLGAAFARVGLMDAPEDRATPTLFSEARHEAERLRPFSALGLIDLAASPALAAAHRAALPTTDFALEREWRLDSATARAKLEVAEAPCAAAYRDLLTVRERLAVARDPALLEAFMAAFGSEPTAAAEGNSTLAAA